MLPISFDKFAAVSGTLLARDWRSCGRGKAHPARNQHQPGTERSAGVGRPAHGRRPAVVDLVSGEYAARQGSVHSGQREPNPVYVKMSHFRVPMGDPIRYRRRSKANSHSGGPFWATRSTPSCATRIEP